MIEPLLVLAALAVGLGLIVLLGHGLWVLLAALLRGALGRRHPVTDDVECLFCGRLNPAGSDRCDDCNHPMRHPLAEELADLDALERQLRRWRDAKLMKPRTMARFEARIAEYRRERFAPQAIRNGETRLVTPSSPVVAGAQGRAVPEPTRQAVEVPVWADVVEAEEVAGPPTVSPEIRTPPRSGKPWQEVVTGFLAEREIHWAEFVGVLVGGFIMVGSSIALVVNLWQTLQGMPYLKFFVLVGYTSLVFVAGLYAVHRWKLRATGGGLLVIATLLVPLNFLAVASLWRSTAGGGALAVEVITLAVFLALLRLAAGVLTPAGRWFVPLTVAGNSAAILVMDRFIDPGQPDWVLAATAYLPVAVFMVGIGGYLFRTTGESKLRGPEVAAILTLLGTGAFALCVAVGLFVLQAVERLGGLPAALDLLAIPFSLAAVPVLAVGLSVMRCRAPDESDAERARLEPALEGRGAVSFATAGTFVMLLGIILAITSLGLAWPQPPTIIGVGLINAAGLSFLAFRYRFPAAHAGAMVCLALGYLVGFHLAVGNLAGVPESGLSRELLRLSVAGQSGTALAGLFGAWVLASLLLKRLRDRRHGQMYGAGAASVAAIGLALVTFYGLAQGNWDATRAAVLYGLYGAGTLVLAVRWKEPGFAYLATGLLAAVPLWTLWGTTGELAPAAATVLAAEGLAAALLASRRLYIDADRKNDGSRRFLLPSVFRRPLVHVGEALAALAVFLWLVTAWTHRASIVSAVPPIATIGFLAGFYFLAAWRLRASSFAWVGSLLVLVGLVHVLAFNFVGIVSEPWLIAPLVHATLGLLGALTIDKVGQLSFAGRHRRMARVFADPLAGSALVGSVLLLIVFPAVWQTNWTYSGGLFWLAALWLGIAIRSGNRAVFGAHQTALVTAAVAATTVGLKQRGLDVAAEWFQPSCLHLYGIVLAMIVLPWPVLRGACGRFSSDSKGPANGDPVSIPGSLVRPCRGSLARNWRFLVSLHPSVDCLVRHGLVFLHFAIAALWLVPELAREIGLPVGPMAEGVFSVGGRGAWLMVGLLAAGSFVALWNRWNAAELLSGLVLAGSVPWLLAAQTIDQVAVASALRWAAGALFFSASVVMWGRTLLGRLTLWEKAGWSRLNANGFHARAKASLQMVRAAMVVLGVLPVLAITLTSVILRLEYVTPRGPLVESIFHSLGSDMNYLVPALLLAMALVGHALCERSGGYALASVLIMNLAGLVVWQARGPLGWRGMLFMQTLVLAGSAVFWTALKLALPKRARPMSFGKTKLAPNHLAALAAMACVVVLVAASALGDISGEYHLAIGWADFAGLLAVAAAVALCLWDPTARFPMPALYLLGLSAVGLALGYRGFDPREYVWTAAPELAGIMVGAGFLGWLFDRMRFVWKTLRIPDADHTWPKHWYFAFQTILGLAVAVLALWVAWDIDNDGVGAGTALFGLAGRWAGFPAALMLLGATITMAWQATGERRRVWQVGAFGAGFLLNLTVGLALLDATPGTLLGEALWLNRCAILFTGAAMLTLLSRFGLKGAIPWAGDWLDTGREVANVFAALTAVILPLLLLGEMLHFDPVTGAPLAVFSVLAVPTLLVPLAVACLSYALTKERAGRAGRSLDGSERTGFTPLAAAAPRLCVYAAEAMVAVAAVHVWLCEPQWFQLGLVEKYWMFLVMALAFTGAGISEWFHRTGLPVLSEPLRNTAMALPVGPMVGFWFVPPTERLLALTGGTPALWLLMALFYGTMAASKPASILRGALTLFTGSMGLWVLLERQQLDFFTHPQLWLIPPALAMLVAERLDRPRLSAGQREAMRYVALSIIYVASTTEFMRGIGDSLWLPLVLLGLSVGGILAGVAMRVRSYIYLGMTFLAVVIVRMIIFAAFEQGRMWLFWVCCILLGASIIALFAVFERRRNTFVAAVRRLRQWE